MRLNLITEKVRSHYGILILLLITFTAGLIMIYLTGRYIDRRHRSDLLDTARLIAVSVPAETISRFQHSPDDVDNPGWREVRDRLSRMQRVDPELSWIYIMKIDRGKIFFLWDTTPEDSPDFAAPGTVYSDAPEELLEVFQTGEGQTIGPYTDKWGTFVSAFVPLADSANSLRYVLGMDIQAGRWDQSVRISQIPIALILVLLLALESILYVYIRRLRMAQLLLRRSNEDLEQRVEERTQSLRVSREALKDSEERFRAVVEQISDGIVLYDLQTRSVLVTNPAYEQMLGYSRDEMANLSMYDIVAHERDDVDHYVQSVMDKTTPPIKERKHRRKDGTAIDVEVSVNIIRFMDRDVLCVVVRDITERKRAEQKERELEQRQAEILRTLPVVIYSAELPSPYAAIWMSDNAESVTGFPARNFTGIPEFWEQRTHPDDLIKVQKDLAKIYQQDYVDLEYRWRCADDRYHWFLDHLVKGKTSGTHIVYFGIWLDISERKAVEEALKASEYKYRNLTEHTSDWVWEMDLRGKFIYSNNRACHILGYSLEDIIGRTPFDFMEPEGAKALQQLFADSVKQNGLSLQLEGTMKCKDGQSAVFEVNSIPVFDERGALQGFRGISRDITERKRAELEKQKLEQQMLHTQKLESLGILAGGIAHDFNNILMTILGYADLAQKKLPPETPAMDSLKEIEKASMRAADLCRQMLAYSGQGRFLIQPIRLNDVVRDMLQMLVVSISKKATLKLNLDDALPLIEGDVAQIRQIIMNLVINASDALTDQPGFISVSTGYRYCGKSELASVWLHEPVPEGQYAYMAVEDTGCGMDAATLNRIFDPFFTTKFAGRGLGLAAVLGIIRGHRGAIQIRSGIGKGTSFTIYFPARPEEPGTAPAGKEPAEAWSGQGTILVVDDDPQISKLTYEILKMLGYKVVTAGGGKEAVEIFTKRPGEFDCVILDLTMPDMDGQAVYEEMRRLDPGVTVIMSSGYSAQEIEKRFADSGMAGFMQKPYDIEALDEKIKSILKNKTRKE